MGVEGNAALRHSACLFEEWLFDHIAQHFCVLVRIREIRGLTTFIFPSFPATSTRWSPMENGHQAKPPRNLWLVAALLTAMATSLFVVFVFIVKDRKSVV